MDKKEFLRHATQLIATYTPSDAVKNRMALVALLATVGPTGVGKTLIMERSGLPYVRSDVTRPPRKHETDGVEYNFRSDYDQLLKEIKNGEFVQYLINRNGEFYGTKDTSYPQSGPCTMAIYADAIPFFRTLGFQMVIPVYIVPPSYEEWMRRVKAHHDSDFSSRLAEARRSLEMALSDNLYFFMINDDLTIATEVFKEFLNNQQHDGASQQRAREVALEILTGIEGSAWNSD